MTIVHDKRHLDPDWERWAKKGLAQESVYSLRFVYLFTQADREKERQMLAGKSDEERAQLEADIVNARDDFMKRVAERVASTFICYNFDPNEEPARFDDVRWELYFWCNHFQDCPGRRDYSYFTLTFNRSHPPKWRLALCKRVLAFLEQHYGQNPNLNVAVQYTTYYDEDRIHMEALRVRDQVLNKRCTWQGMAGKLVFNGERVLFMKRYARSKAYRVSDFDVLNIYWALHPEEGEELVPVCQT